MTASNRGSDSAPRLSIIVATWNAVGALERCLKSIISQDFASWELLIPDAASTDGTAELIRKYEKHIAWWRSEPDQGIYDAWNKALPHARGEYVCFLGADDAWHSQVSLLTAFDVIDNREYDLVTARGHLIDRNGNLLEAFGKPWDYRAVMRRMTICHPGAFHRRNLFKRFGMFDSSYRICADYDFLLRLPAELRTLHIDAPMVDVSDFGISRDHRWLMLRERYRAQASCPRIGRARAAFNYIDKLWRIPVAKALGLRN